MTLPDFFIIHSRTIFPDCYTRELSSSLYSCFPPFFKKMLLYVEYINCEFRFGSEKGPLGLISIRTITLKIHSEPRAKNCEEILWQKELWLREFNLGVRLSWLQVQAQYFTILVILWRILNFSDFFFFHCKNGFRIIYLSFILRIKWEQFVGISK